MIKKICFNTCFGNEVSPAPNLKTEGAHINFMGSIVFYSKSLYKTVDKFRHWKD